MKWFSNNITKEMLMGDKEDTNKAQWSQIHNLRSDINRLQSAYVRCAGCDHLIEKASALQVRLINADAGPRPEKFYDSSWGIVQVNYYETRCKPEFDEIRQWNSGRIAYFEKTEVGGFSVMKELWGGAGDTLPHEEA